MNHFISIVLLGIIEGITEFLPISSTGHLLIAEHWLGAMSETFNVVIQAGAVLAVVLIYREKLQSLFTRWSEPGNEDYLAKLLLSFGITAVLGLVVKHFGVKLPEEVGPVAWALLIGGLGIFIGEKALQYHSSKHSISWTIAIAVGVAQIIAGVFPGTSRSAATIIISMLFGLSRPAAIEFSFLVGIPTMFAASGFELWHHRHDPDLHAPGAFLDLSIGFVVSTVIAFIAVKWLLHYIQRHTFSSFAWYRVILGTILLIWVWTSGMGKPVQEKKSVSSLVPPSSQLSPAHSGA